MGLNIGLVYDLRSEYLALGFSPEAAAEFDGEGTIAAIEAALRELGHKPQRVGRGLELARRLAAGERWDLVFNIAEGVKGRSREAQAPAFLEAYDVPYTFCDPLTAALTLDKAMAKRVARDAGLATADFMLVEDVRDLERCALKFPLFVKPNAEGTGKGVGADSLAGDMDSLRRVCGRLLAEFHQPALVESFLPGLEVTAGIVGSGERSRVIGVLAVGFLPGAGIPIHSYENKENWRGRIDYRLLAPGVLRDETAALALAAYRLLGCRDAGRIDLRADAAGRPCFIEANPLAGLNPGHSDLCIINELAGQEYRDLIGDIVKSALERARAL